MLSGGLLMFYLFKQGFRKQLPLLIGTAVLMVLSFSAYAYSVLLIALLIYVLITNRNRGKMLLVLAGMLLVVVVGVPFLLETFHVSGYFTDRFQFNFDHLIKNGQFHFVRVVFPGDRIHRVCASPDLRRGRRLLLQGICGTPAQAFQRWTDIRGSIRSRIQTSGYGDVAELAVKNIRRGRFGRRHADALASWLRS